VDPVKRKEFPNFYGYIPNDSTKRTVLKVCMVHFAGVIQMRHPVELGGMYWTVNMFLALVASFVSVWIGGGGETEWLLVGKLSAAWVATFGLILLMMKKEYLGTFPSTKTGKQKMLDLFLKGEDDTTKMRVLGINKRLWVSIYPQVKDFVLANWSRWTEEKPDFFTSNFIARVPSDMIPAAAQNEAKQVSRAKQLSEATRTQCAQRRRSSLGNTSQIARLNARFLSRKSRLTIGSKLNPIRRRETTGEKRLARNALLKTHCSKRAARNALLSQRLLFTSMSPLFTHVCGARCVARPVRRTVLSLVMRICLLPSRPSFSPSPLNTRFTRADSRKRSQQLERRPVHEADHAGKLMLFV